jgi:hypothetical protein
VRQPQRVVRNRKPSIHEKRPAQGKEIFLGQPFDSGLKKILNIIANLFSKSD